MSKTVKCSGNFPKELLELMKKRVEQENLSSVSDYIKNALMEEILSPEMYLAYRRESDPSYNMPDRGPNNENYCLLSIDTYMDGTNFSDTEKYHFTLTQELMDWVDAEAKAHNLNKTKLITILIIKEIADENVYLNYRSIFDKPWMYRYNREVFHCVHEDDPDQSTDNIPDEDMSWDPDHPSYDPTYHTRYKRPI